MSAEPHLTDVLITSRPLANYLDFFGLTSADLAGQRILDCPGGASSFTAEARALGADSIALDPTYGKAPTEFAGIGRDQIALSDDWFRSNPQLFLPAGRGDANISAIIAARHHALDLFLSDYENEPERYVAGQLPFLPFPDESFDLVLSSHLLFTYADRFDRDFHLAGILELLRVSAGEVRIYPLSDYLGITAPWFDDLIAKLRHLAVGVTIAPVVFRVTRSWTTQLILKPQTL